jgi:hypothetical protein
VNEIVLGGLWENVAGFAPVKFGIVDDVVELLFPGRNLKVRILWNFRLENLKFHF